MLTGKKLLLIAATLLAFSFAADSVAKAGLSVGIGIGAPVGYGYYGYARPAYYPYGYGCASYGYAPYGYSYRPVVGVYVRPRYYHLHHRRHYPYAYRRW